MDSTAPVSNAYGKRSDVPAGSAGDIYAKLQSSVDNVLFDQDNPPVAYGVPSVLTADEKARAFADGDDATDIKGAIVRTDPDRANLDGTPNVDHVHGRIIRGGFLAVIAIGTPKRDGQVYIRTVADAPKAIGDLEATEAAGENIAVPNWSFAIGGKDASNLGVIRIGA